MITDIQNLLVISVLLFVYTCLLYIFPVLMSHQLSASDNHYSSLPSVFLVCQGDVYMRYGIIHLSVWNTRLIQPAPLGTLMGWKRLPNPNQSAFCSVKCFPYDSRTSNLLFVFILALLYSQHHTVSGQHTSTSIQHQFQLSKHIHPCEYAQYDSTT